MRKLDGWAEYNLIEVPMPSGPPCYKIERFCTRQSVSELWKQATGREFTPPQNNEEKKCD